jgi:hypothetical protein
MTGELWAAISAPAIIDRAEVTRATIATRLLSLLSLTSVLTFSLPRPFFSISELPPNFGYIAPLPTYRNRTVLD